VCVSYEEEDTCVCVSYEEEDTCVCVSYEEEDTCVSFEERARLAQEGSQGPTF